MKKTIALLASLGMAAGLVACKDKTKKPADRNDARKAAPRKGATSRKAPAPARKAAAPAKDAKKAAKAPAKAPAKRPADRR